MIGRLRRHRHSEPAVELNVIPLIDVVFFLLVFYVISTSFTPETAVPVERPGSTQAATSTQPYATVAITAAGEVVIGGRTANTAGLQPLLRQEMDRAGSTRVVLIADRTLPTGQLLAVMDACTAAGGAPVEIAATPIGGGP